MNENTSLEDMFQSVQTPAREEQLRPIGDYLQMQENNKEKQNLEKLCNESGRRMEDFYYVDFSPTTPICYFKQGVFVALHTLSQWYLNKVNVQQLINNREGQVLQFKEEQRFSEWIAMTEPLGKLLVFDHILPMMPKRQVYNVFKRMYLHMEYGFGFLTKENLAYILSTQPSEVRKRAQEKIETLLDVTQNDKVFIYRGLGESSTSVKEAMSWTISEQTAYFFANRLSHSGSVVKASVYVRDILDYMDDRDEAEVWVKPADITLIEELTSIHTSEEMSHLMEMGLAEEYQSIRQHLLLDEPFENPHGVHGVKHTRRVLLHCISLSNAMGLSPVERGVLTTSAIYHDIGRKHDGECKEHGRWSVEKMDTLKLPMTYLSVDENHDLSIGYLNDEGESAVRFIIIYHCRPDKDAEKALEKMDDGYTKELILKLYPIFKDADALDRVRLGDLDPTFLRTKEARKRVRFAEEVYKFLE
ncbi:HD domain-containing protein [Rossellomorea marisflavi]|uniref:HD domain-containing protein n=1 Tax=Rossellomorea marisflavi TaxID=189381 RepID=UPI003FA0411D